MKCSTTHAVLLADFILDWLWSNVSPVGSFLGNRFSRASYFDNLCTSQWLECGSMPYRMHSQEKCMCDDVYKTSISSPNAADALWACCRYVACVLSLLKGGAASVANWTVHNMLLQMCCSAVRACMCCDGQTPTICILSALQVLLKLSCNRLQSYSTQTQQCSS